MNWIPIDKSWPDKGKLPNNLTDVLVSMDDDVFEAYRLGDYFCRRYANFTISVDKVDAWMPMPKPYKE